MFIDMRDRSLGITGFYSFLVILVPISEVPLDMSRTLNFCRIHLLRTKGYWPPLTSCYTLLCIDCCVKHSMIPLQNAP